ncbi:hypothetical protein SISNIDRAFT_405172 [Sistotremastrum niveocremeum HHB9708]|uniref:EF-hand domain-containing protein n=1 Tax=Sistotremastrum niveocremeum HHB9708 TaxID=1314777 RepID=A0A164Z5M3_9AGAM|nr:hypothetical protein SISNIDRAFT_405172 [Sistotremastrum niveocremeum HHB9708]
MDVPNDEKRPTELDVKGPDAKVHYPSDLPALPSPRYLPNRTETGDGASSRASSIAGTDDEDEDEDYDWSAEEDLVDAEAKFEQKMDVKSKKPQGWGPKRIITFFLSTLIGSTLLAGLLVAAPILLKFLWLDKHDSENNHFIWEQVCAWVFWVAANLILSWYFAFLVDIFPVLAKLIVQIVWGEVSEMIKSRLEFYHSAKNSLKPMIYGATAWASWVIIFDSIYHLYDHANEDDSRARYTPRAFQVVEFLFFVMLILSAEKMLSHLIAFAFHKKAFQDRIEEISHALKVVDHLRMYRPKHASGTPRSHSRGLRTSGFALFGLTPSSEKENPTSRSPTVQTPGNFSGDEDGNIADSEGAGGTRSRKGKGRNSWFLGQRTPPRRDTDASKTPSGVTTPIPLGHLTKPSQHSVHVYPPSSVESPTRDNGADTPESKEPDVDTTLRHAAKVLKSTVLHDARNIHRVSDADGAAGLAWNVTSAHEAKKVARSIYIAFKGDRKRQWLVPSDFEPAYPTKAEAEEAFKVFDKDGNGDISRAEIKTTVLKLYKERRFLSRSLRDVGIALKSLDHIMIFFAIVMLFFISLSVFGVSVGASLTSIYSLGIAASFIFKNSASNAFDAIVYHSLYSSPYDTGDRCFIDNENLVVKKTSLFATVFTRADGSMSYYFNSQLFNKFICNLRRSGKQAENLTMQVSWRTPLEKLDALEKCMNEWLATEQNRWFQPSTSVTLSQIDFQKSLVITMGIGHNGTWQDWGLRNARKTAFHAAVNYYCRQLGITCYNSTQPVSLVDSLNFQTTANLARAEDDQYAIASPTTTEMPPHSAKDMKPSLGFLPPPERRSNLTRARKSKGKKGILRTMDGGDG